VPSEQPELTVERILDSGKNIRFGKGVVAKTSYIAGLTLAVWGIVAWRWSENMTSNLGLGLVGAIATLFSLWFIRGTQDFGQLYT
jgi:hypothetical protein